MAGAAFFEGPFSGTVRGSKRESLTWGFSCFGGLTWRPRGNWFWTCLFVAAHACVFSVVALLRGVGGK